MHKVMLKPNSGMFARCLKCMHVFPLTENHKNVSMVVAFNHPNQEFEKPCPQCGQPVRWTPSGTTVKPVEN